MNKPRRKTKQISFPQLSIANLQLKLKKLFLNFSKAARWKYWIRRDSTWPTKNGIYLAYHAKCGGQGVSSTVSKETSPIKL